MLRFSSAWFSRVFSAIFAVSLGMCLLNLPAQGQTYGTIAFFEESLAADGVWLWHSTYGRVWRPHQIGPEWRPYMYGRWAYTNEYGWIWVSQERWGWVVYHYGHWVWTSEYGWVWVPRDMWAPSWVEWCYGKGYVGWSPMPPDPFWTDGYYYGSWDCSSPRYSSRWVYVSESNFLSANVSAHVVASAQVAVVARGTTNVTNYARGREGMVNRSIDVTKLQAVTGKAVRPVRIVQSSQPGPMRLGAQELTIFKPISASDPFKKSPSAKPELNLEHRTDGDLLSPQKDIFSQTPPSLPRQPDLVPPSPPTGSPPSGGILGGKGGGLLRR